MNERDWVDWVVIGASILSSFSILATIVVYFAQVNIKKSDEIKELQSMKSLYTHELHENTVTIMNDVDELIDEAHQKYGVNVNADTGDVMRYLSELRFKNVKIKLTPLKLHGYSHQLNLVKIHQFDIELFNLITIESACIESIIRNTTRLKYINNESTNTNLDIFIILQELYKANIYLREKIQSNPYY
ncbi:TPA: hypothetical protein ACS70C_002861 [Providencia alcalifaciens]